MNKKKWMIINAALIVAAAIAVCLILGLGGGNEDGWQEQYDLGIRFLSEGNYEAAVLAFGAAIQIDPNRTDAYLGRAQAYIALGAPEAAREDLDKVLDQDPNNEEALEILEQLDLIPPEETTPGQIAPEQTESQEDPQQVRQQYADYFWEHYTQDDMVCLADVTHDGMEDMIVVHFADPDRMQILGYVYTLREGTVTEIYSKLGSSTHAGGFFGWYLIPVPGSEYYNLCEESFGMWQGMGILSFREYLLDEEGNEIETDYLYVDSSEEGSHDENGYITEAAYENYERALSDKQSLCYCLYAAMTEGSGSQPMPMNPGEVFP